VEYPVRRNDVSQALEKTGYRFVQENIRKRIITGEWAIGSKIPSERELERDLQISRLTVSKGLAHLVAEGLLIRRQGQGTFVSDRTSHVSSNRKLIKFISPIGPGEDRNSVRHGILEGMYDALIDRGYHVGVDFYRNSVEQIQRLQQDSDQAHAGFVIWYEPGNQNLDELIRLRQENYPFVLVDAYPMDFETDFAVTDNTEGGRVIMEYLVEHGHRHIGYISRTIDRSSLRDRQAGFLQGMINHGIPFDSSSVVTLDHTSGDLFREVGLAIDALLSRDRSLTAIFFCNDDLALAAIDYIRSRGMRVPEDISIASFDDIDRSAYCSVPLTTIHQDFFEMGKAAAEVLLEKLTGKPEARPVQISLKPRLVERVSVSTVKI
jgi:DNA-binding LacI/PurR family transcriptional regulator